MGTLVTWIICAGIAAASLLASRSLMHYFQLESYQFPGYFRTLRRQGVRSWIPGGGMALAAAAAGADGLIIEVHNDPAHALCDGKQSLTPEQFDRLAKAIQAILPYSAKEMSWS